jgi:prephenate dehydrogenase (NADP+)
VTQKFFEPRFEGAVEMGQAMIKAVLESERAAE